MIAPKQDKISARVGWVVDVQRDFMEPTGRLYVHHLSEPGDPGARNAIPAIARAVRWMRAHCVVVVYTGDWHDYDDREIDRTQPDARAGTYPPHCMGLSPDESERRGAALIPAIAPPESMLLLRRDAPEDEARAIAHQAVREHRPIFLQKGEFCPFAGNAATDPFVLGLEEALGGRPEFVVCGVATDVCVKRAVDGLLDRGHVVRVVPDATWGLGLLGPEETFDLWARRGAALTPIGVLESL